jgi:6-phosphogluconate dehydrogenase
MGAGIIERLRNAGHEVIAFDQNHELLESLSQNGVETAFTLEDLVSSAGSPRVLWLSLPAGEPTNKTLEQLAGLLSSGDTVCDSGNSHFDASRQHATMFSEKGIHFLDIGISGGLGGRTAGYPLSIGGAAEAVAQMQPIFAALAPEGGVLHVGASGAGHYVKMVHNGIEYGVMQAYAEGFHVLSDGAYQGQLPLKDIASLWQHGSIIRSYVGELTVEVLSNRENIDSIAPVIDDNGEGRWTVEEALRATIPTPVIAAAVMTRYQSRQTHSFAFKLLAALRSAFGGHATHK